MAASLAIWARTRDLRTSQLVDALEGSRTLVRTWSLRGTLHLHAAEDLGWLLPLVGPLFIRRSRRRFAELGLSDEIYEKACPILEALLAAQGPQTRAEVAAHLANRGIPTEGQAAYHLLRRAGLDGRICYGPKVNGEPTYVLLNDWVRVPDLPDADAALLQLTQRYLAAYGPVRPGDFAAWSGLSLPTARNGFAGLARELRKVEVKGQEAWLLQGHADRGTEETPTGPLVRLLPGYDPYLLGYQHRDLMVAPEHARQIHPGGGILRATLLVDGMAAGIWSRRRRTHDLVVQVQHFENLPPGVLPALEVEVEHLGNFLATATVLDLKPPG
jgi:hypothetical protein